MENETHSILNGTGMTLDYEQQVISKVITLSAYETWGYGFLFVTFINLSSVMGILFFPLMKKSFYTIVMRCMIGLAIGSLSGSALFHLIPQAFDLQNSSQSNYIDTASFIWFAIWLVMMLECSIKITVKTRAEARKRNMAVLNERDDESFIGPENNNPDVKCKATVPSESTTETELSVVENGYRHVNHNDDEDPRLDTNKNDECRSRKSSVHSHMHVYHSTFSLNKHVLNAMDEKPKNGDIKEIKTVAWIVIIGDSLHNFIDGVSIGAGFTQSFSTGLILSLAVICEEFPHELGDFAILINSGLSVKKAILFNFLSALTCYLGLALGILLGKIEYENLIFAFAAGLFLYVSLADMIPEVTSLIDEVCEISPNQAWIVLINHNVGIIVGISILYVLASWSP